MLLFLFASTASAQAGESPARDEIVSARFSGTERIVHWSGLIRIDHDTVIPRGMLVIVESGTRIVLENAVLRVEGELKASHAEITGGGNIRSTVAFAPGSRGILRGMIIWHCATGLSADSSGLWLDNCVVTENSGCGLEIRSSRLALRGGSVSSNGLHGLYAGGQSVLLMEGVDFIENGLNGVCASDGIEVTATDCDFSDNLGRGLVVDSLGRLNMKHCRLYENRGSGLEASFCGSVVFADGIISGNGAGLFLSSNRDVRIERSEIRSSRGDNVTVAGGACSIGGSTRIENAARCGIRVFAGAEVRLEYGVVIQSNRSHGLIVLGARVTLNGAVVRINGGNGILVETGGKVELNTACQVHGNGRHGVEIDDGEALIITADFFENGGRGIAGSKFSHVYVDPHCRFYSNALPNMLP